MGEGNGASFSPIRRLEDLQYPFSEKHKGIHPVIYTNNGGMYRRTELKNFAQVLFSQIVKHNYNKNSISDLYDTIWHSDVSPDKSLTRIIVMPPLEVREKCDQIARRRTNSRQIELDIEATIMEWCAGINVTPRHAVYTNRPAVLFFDNDSALVMAKIVLNDLDLICDLKKRCRDAF